ncbi:unnamed protein product [Amoebophrya sp. A25]|nr:unnamed protein product [Amoebophrya sp. A25]|eukprot:GSA25T00016220001.1
MRRPPPHLHTFAWIFLLWRIKMIAGLCSVPFRQIAMLYGTAWKEERTTELVKRAFQLGFRGVDTACQPKHYQEHLVGQALKELIDEGVITRQDVWIQTKYTSIDGQDANKVPYDKDAPLEEQVRQSVEVSRQNLQVEQIDSLVLHGPVKGRADLTMKAWRAMENAVDEGKVAHLGVSNVYDLPFFEYLYTEARYKPIVLQNRFYVQTGFDRELRDFCRERNIRYQSFWTLTANPGLLKSPPVQRLAQTYNATSSQVLYRYIIDSSGGQPLSGCKDPQHIQEAVAVQSLGPLTEADVASIEEVMYAGRKGSSKREL